jgi:hypothetical protein
MHPYLMELLADQHAAELRRSLRHPRHVTRRSPRGSVRHRAGRTLVEVGLRLAGGSADG